MCTAVGRVLSISRKKHCCPSCTCAYIANPERKRVEAALETARESDLFRDLGFVWSKDEKAIALLGFPKRHQGGFFSEQITFLGQWHLMSREEEIPSYEKILEGLRRNYRSAWHRIGRIIICILILVGAYLMAPVVPHLFHGGNQFLNQNPELS